MADNLKIIDTGDGSHTLINLSLDETYHSRHGALQESRHVFIRHGLQHRLQWHGGQGQISIFEMGLGTGLNLILTIEQALQSPDIKFAYTSLEAYPLSWDIVQRLNYCALLGKSELNKYFEEVHQLPWDHFVEVLPNFKLKKKALKLEAYSAEDNSFDLIYYDAFAPGKQPELWTKPVMAKLSAMLKPEGVFVTYSAKGQLKRDLKALGLTLETLEGPPGKAEMIRAEKRRYA